MLLPQQVASTLLSALLLASPALTAARDRRLLDQSSGFVYAEGTHLMLDGQTYYFAGTNAFYLSSLDVNSDDQVRTFFEVQSANGVRVVRFWGFVNGYGGGSVSSTPNPIQPSLGKRTTAVQQCRLSCNPVTKASASGHFACRMLS